MDLSSWNSERDKRIVLDGEWEFYWGELLSPTDFQKGSQTISKPDYIQVPAAWNSKVADGEPLQAYGAATYRLRIAHLPADGVYALKTAGIRFASAIYVNGKKLLEDGHPSTDKQAFRSGNTPRMGAFASNDNEVELIVQVANFEYINAGITAPIEFGEQAVILSKQQQRTAWQFIVIGILVSLGLIYLLCFLATIHYGSKDNSLLVFAIFVFLFACYNGLMGERPLAVLFDGTPFGVIYRIKDIISLLSSILLTLVFYQLRKNKVSLRIAQGVAFILGGACFLVALLPIPMYIPVYSIVIVVYQSLMIGLMIRIGLIYIRGKEHNARTLLLFTAVLCINLYSVDVILYAYSLRSGIGAGQFFLVVFNLLLIALVVMRFFEAYRTVEAMKDQLLLADKIKDDFLVNTSHELRTPLNAMINIADTMVQGVSGPVREEEAKNLAIIAASGRKLTSLVNDILDYSKIKHGDVSLNKTGLDLKAATESVVVMHRFLLQDKPLSIQNAIGKPFPAVFADAGRLNQILHNLIGNAVKFTESGSVKISARVIRNHAEICVADSGPGIAPEQQARIFAPFEQADTTAWKGGSGLGLGIAKKLVELHGGLIHVESAVGEGASFYFTLPLFDSAEPGADADKTELALPFVDRAQSLVFPIRVQGADQGSILIVDDDSANLQTMMNLMQLQGYGYTAVNSAETAWEEISRNPAAYSLVILDIMMPDISGYELLARLRSRFSMFELPILMLTARNRLEDIRFSLENGANDIVGKPFEAEELVARVQSLVNLRAFVKQAKQAEISFLRSQIKPHFLFNALNAIAEMCVTEPNQAERLILELSRYLRKSFDFKALNSYTTLAGELELVEAYVCIELSRFGSRLQMEYEIEADEMIRIPSLILQPLVENAIRHGVMAGTRSGRVKLTVRVQAVNGDLYCAIEDDGCGIPEEKLQVILKEETDSKGVGLWNIRKQLKLLYGEDIHIESAAGRGTKVWFQLPLKEEER
ncbi:ATP-binding protein [Paenibacillus sp. HB172176]|uniref:hybrid sensor histidine kinase/response regulator n=1 Tax=Paenibacillus sp. HB172176 TaxID=2493690 RepID=UPI00143C9679|nr:ATP-binding protein [Paenibacillus sp. HB172176]